MTLNSQSFEKSSIKKLSMPSEPRAEKPLMRARLLLFALPMALLLTTGCASLLTSKRKLLTPVAPGTVMTATPDQLVAQINDAWAKFQSLTATVDVRASHLKTQEGTATDYPNFRANLLLRKPGALRVLGHAPLIQTTMFDLGSDGTHFRLVIPPENLVYQGLNASKGDSPKWYENLRPDPLFNSMVLRGLEPDEFYSVISDSDTKEDLQSKHLVLHPEYILNIVRRKPDSQELFPVRVIRFDRENLLPVEQDLYDDKGTLSTQVIYAAYRDFDGTKYPSTITLKVPQNEYQLVMTVERVSANPPLTDDQFQVNSPKGATVKDLK
jgi:outer membrane lipoprotein-sorting protein